MYRIILDSCGELTESMKAEGCFINVPLTLIVGDEEIVDDSSFDQKSFLKKVEECPSCPKSACPSPEEYMEKFDKDDENYVVTLSSNLSGSYNSACLARDMFLEEYPDAKVAVFDSRSASVGETLIGLKIKELLDMNKSFDEVVEEVERYIAEQHTYFVLESLEALRKNGRLSNLKALIANTLNIKPVLASTDEGTIVQLGQARGMNKSLEKMVEFFKETAINVENKTIAISHCNCVERALQLKGLIESSCKVKDIVIVDTAGVSSLYASDGGIIMVV